MGFYPASMPSSEVPFYKTNSRKRVLQQCHALSLDSIIYTTLFYRNVHINRTDCTAVNARRTNELSSEVRGGEGGGGFRKLFARHKFDLSFHLRLCSRLYHMNIPPMKSGFVHAIPSASIHVKRGPIRLTSKTEDVRGNSLALTAGNQIN